MTGRLVCDLKISAKELIRCKSYDLGPLVERLLGKPAEERQELSSDDVLKAFDVGSSRQLIAVANRSLADAADVLQVGRKCFNNSDWAFYSFEEYYPLKNVRAS